MYRSLACLALSLGVGCAEPAVNGDSGDDMGTVTGWFTIGHFITGDGLENIELCVVDTGTCESTDANGNATLLLPADADIALTVAGYEYLPQIFPLRTTSEQLVLSYFLTPKELAMAAVNAAGLEFDESAGHVAVSLLNASWESVPGYAGTLSAGDGPYYLDDLSVGIDLSLTQTSSSGRLVGLAIPTETVTLTLEGPGTCVPRSYYWQAGPNTAVMAVLPGFVSGVSMVCE
jgi:hypothetical protein